MFIPLSKLSEKLHFETSYYSNNKKTIIKYKDHRIVISTDCSFILIDDTIAHLYTHIHYSQNDYFIPAKSFINQLRDKKINTRMKILNNKLIISYPDNNISSYKVIKKGNGYSIEIFTSIKFNEDYISISKSSNNWISVSIVNGHVDSLQFNKSPNQKPIIETKTLQIDNIAQLSFLLSIIPDDFDVFVKENKIIIRLDISQKLNAEKIKKDKKKYIFDTVILDAGHGGKDPGAVANGIKEKDVTLPIVKMIGDKLEKSLGVKVIYTRDEDVFLSLNKRTEIANQNEGDVFLSIHANSIDNSPHTKGFETYLLRPGKTQDAIDIAIRENSVIKEFESENQNYNQGGEFILASIEQNAYIKDSEFLAREIQYQLSNTLKNKKLNRGVKQAGFQVLVGASMPNVLIEVGFLTNSQEAHNLTTKKYQQKIAQGIVNALIVYKNKYEQHIIE